MAKVRIYGTLFTTFKYAANKVVALPWRIYDVAQHNKLLCDDYSQANYNDLPKEVDSYKVKSVIVGTDCVRVFVGKAA